jgi:DNA-binding response OmpR family regulator
MSNRILIVDDDPTVRQFVDLILTQHGYNISSAATPDTAMQILGRESFGLVLLDIRMPGMSGLDILRLMRARPNRPKILMMTAQRDPGTIMQAIEQGADGYLVKPFKPLDLLKRVDAALRGPIAAPSLATPAVLDELILD